MGEDWHAGHPSAARCAGFGDRVLRTAGFVVRTTISFRRRVSYGAVPYRDQARGFLAKSAWARSLTQQLEATKLQMSGHMSMLQAEVALLKENVIRMKLAGIRYAGMASTHSSAEVSAAAIMQHQRRFGLKLEPNSFASPVSEAVSDYAVKRWSSAGPEPPLIRAPVRQPSGDRVPPVTPARSPSRVEFCHHVSSPTSL
jgi:hypothetical protein